MIARGFLEEILDRWRRIVRRRVVVSDDALVLGQFESRLQLETSDAIDIHRHQVEPWGRYLHGQVLPSSSVPSSKKGGFATGLRQVIARADAEGLGNGDWAEVLGGSAAAMGNRMSGSVHDGQSLLW